MKYFTKIFSLSDKKIHPASRYPFPEKSDLYPLVVSLKIGKEVGNKITEEESNNLDTEIRTKPSSRMEKMLEELERRRETGKVVPFETPRESGNKPLNETPSTSASATSHNNVSSVSSNTTSPNLPCS